MENSIDAEHTKKFHYFLLMTGLSNLHLVVAEFAR